MRAIKISKTQLQKMKDSILLSDFIRHTCPDLPDDDRRNKRCLCPFHKEKSPSLVVNDSLNKFYCFGCGASGDHLNFIFYQHFHERWVWDERFDMYDVHKDDRKNKPKIFMDCVRKLSQITGVPIIAKHKEQL